MLQVSGAFLLPCASGHGHGLWPSLGSGRGSRQIIKLPLFAYIYMYYVPLSQTSESLFLGWELWLWVGKCPVKILKTISNSLADGKIRDRNLSCFSLPSREKLISRILIEKMTEINPNYYYKQKYYLFHMFVHIFIMYFYGQQNHISILVLLPKLFFPLPVMLKKSLGEKHRVNVGRKQVNRCPDSPVRLWREAILFFQAIIWISRYGEDVLSSPGAFRQSPFKQAF